MDCTSVKLLVLSLTDVDPIPDGSVLYTCTVAISFFAPDGTYPLDTNQEDASTPDGEAVATEGIDGAVVGPGEPPAPAIATATERSQSTS